MVTDEMLPHRAYSSDLMYRDPVWRISRKPLWLPMFSKRKKRSSLDGIWMICCNWGETVGMNFCGKYRDNLKTEVEHHVQYQSRHTQVFWKQSEVQYLSFKLNYSGGKDELEADFDWIHLPTHGICHVPWWWRLLFPFLWSSLKRLQYEWGWLRNEDHTLRNHLHERKQPKPRLLNCKGL